MDHFPTWEYTLYVQERPFLPLPAALRVTRTCSLLDNADTGSADELTLLLSTTMAAASPKIDIDQVLFVPAAGEYTDQVCFDHRLRSGNG